MVIREWIPPLNTALRILQTLSNARIFPKNNYFKAILGIAWIIEAQLESYFAGIYVTRYLWEIIGPVNIGLFLSVLFATIYGALSLGLAFIRFMKWFTNKYQKVTV